MERHHAGCNGEKEAEKSITCKYERCKYKCREESLLKWHMQRMHHYTSQVSIRKGAYCGKDHQSNGRPEITFTKQTQAQ
ncbi:hypothetical protein ASPWEDRAFT_35904 [Aspergillus wentii DTO 134E9]|uniref:C2H2-type domain-containing protein n=1 Tax=Aspergillus wentii DTO 134E9 TaxID=1073089 RepID=A0A1L9RTM9_ASPWE|nr:uncharacterized protein ASPWEDRAFT_35904 [Aspergillus wentii DTO 134E9]OJJ38279.1 hypothetical protein ASPWEDRAFT_35904 [Aspergillus wentii DTO 134E9]